MLEKKMPENFKNILLKRYDHRLHVVINFQKWPPKIKHMMYELAKEVILHADNKWDFIGYTYEGYTLLKDDLLFSQYLIEHSKLTIDNLRWD